MDWVMKTIWEPLTNLVNRAKWFLIAVAFVVTAGGFFYAGATYEKGRWDAQNLLDQQRQQEIKDDYEKKMLAQQAEADRRAQSFASKQQSDYAHIQNLDRRLNDEIQKNSFSRTCIVPSNWLPFYESARTGAPMPADKPAR